MDRSLQPPKGPEKGRFNLRKLTRNLFGRKRKKDQAVPVTHQVGNWFDVNVLGLFAPSWANNRIKARNQHLELSAKREMYHNALSGRFHPIASEDTYRGSRWKDTLLSPDSGADEDHEQMQIRCRELYRSNTIAQSAIEGRVAHEVGEGILPQSQVSDFGGYIEKDSANEIRRHIERNFRLWSEGGVDTSREFTFAQFQARVCREFANMGEAFVLVGDSFNPRGPYSLALQLVSAERIETPPFLQSQKHTRLGVQYGATYLPVEGDKWEVDQLYPESMVTGYWVRTEHPGENGYGVEYKHHFYPRFTEDGQPRMLHIFDPIFPEQSRGIPWLATAGNRMKDVDDFFEAELVAKQIEACFGVNFVTDPNGADGQSLASQAQNDTVTSGYAEEDLYPGMIHYGPEEIKTIDPNRPGGNFAPFIEAALRSIAGSLNYPYELLAKNFMRTTFSSGKLSMLDGKRGFKMRQNVLIDMLCRPVWKSSVFQMIELRDLLPMVELSDYRRMPDLYEDAIWRSRPFGAIDEEKEYRSRDVAISSELATRSQFAQEDGTDFFEDEEIRLQEKKARKTTELELMKYEQDERSRLGLEEMPSSEEEEMEPQETESVD